MSAAAAQTVNPNADVLKKGDASNMNINAARGLQDVLKSNLGPKGTLKMLVSGAGDIKLTKDGKVLLTEMQIQNPTACMIARIATAQDDTTGDGTTSAVLIVGEIMKQAERHLSDGVHPRLLCEGIEAAKGAVLQFLDSVRVAKDCTDRPLLLQIAQASLRTKMHVELADKFTEMVVDAVLCVRKPDAPIDLHMVEIMHMQHKSGMESRLVKGLVMDHGGRHPGMPKKLSKVRILTMNIDLEYQKSEVNSGFYYNSAEQREKMVAAERKCGPRNSEEGGAQFGEGARAILGAHLPPAPAPSRLTLSPSSPRWVDDRVDLVLALKKKACKEGETLLLINQKGIDPLALDMLAREGVLALRRAKRRNMERVVLACGGEAINSLDGMEPEICG